MCVLKCTSQEEICLQRACNIEKKGWVHIVTNLFFYFFYFGNQLNKTLCSTVVFGQYKCSGPGAKQAGRVPWSHELTDMEAHPFLSLSFVDGDEWVKP